MPSNKKNKQCTKYSRTFSHSGPYLPGRHAEKKQPQNLCELSTE